MVTSWIVELRDDLKADTWLIPKLDADTPVRRSSESSSTSSVVEMVGNGVGDVLGKGVG